MNKNEYTYNIIQENKIYINNEFKKKGKEYGIITLNKKQIDALAESIDLMSVSPMLSPKFSVRIERFLIPRFNELTGIIYSEKSLPPEIGIELSKENNEDIIKGFEAINVQVGLKEKGYSLEELKNMLKKVKYTKFK
ncbi:MAG: hypothetical protein ACFFEY_03625 [Candidatus Thorarchaeota archaeon]